MRKRFFNIAVLSLITFCCMNSMEAIGGRAGGARGGNVGARGASAQGRGAQGARPQLNANIASPSMSRANIGSRQSFQTVRPQQANSAVTRSQLQQFTQNNAINRGSSGAALNQNLSSALPQLRQNNSRTASQVTGQFRQQYPNANNLLNNRLNSNYYGNNANLWRNAGWAATAGWMGLDAYNDSYPAYYYDPNGIPAPIPQPQAINYAPQNVIVTPPQTAQTAASELNPATAMASGEWLSLGVFAVGSNAEEAAYSNKVMQISINKEGYISGTYFNAATDKSYAMEGMVNKNSQEAIWKTSDNPESPVAWTGLYNLTQDVADIQVRYPNGDEQSKVLVRLQN